MKYLLTFFLLPLFLFANGNQTADIVAVNALGKTGSYTFFVTIKSPDINCEQYTDWWEVLDENGNLLYRRILFHSHAKEQPFRRSGGEVRVSENQKIYIRAHMKPFGYAKAVFEGSVLEGFALSTGDFHFKKVLETTAPQPTSCWY